MAGRVRSSSPVGGRRPLPGSGEGSLPPGAACEEDNCLDLLNEFFPSPGLGISQTRPPSST